MSQQLTNKQQARRTEVHDVCITTTLNKQQTLFSVCGTCSVEYNLGSILIIYKVMCFFNFEECCILCTFRVVKFEKYPQLQRSKQYIYFCCCVECFFYIFRFVWQTTFSLQFSQSLFTLLHQQHHLLILLRLDKKGKPQGSNKYTRYYNTNNTSLTQTTSSRAQYLLHV